MAHQRTTTYELTPGDPVRIDLTTVYTLPSPPAPTPSAFELRRAEAEWFHPTVLSVSRVSLPPTTLFPGLHPTTVRTQGLLRVRGDVLTYVVSNPDHARPASFDARPGDGLTVVTLTRVRPQ